MNEISVKAHNITVAGQVPVERHQIRPTLTPTYAVDADRVLPWWTLRLGPVLVVGVQVELSSVTGAAIMASSPIDHTLVATMVNGAAKYLPDAQAFDRGTYEALSSRYAKGGAEALAAAILDDLTGGSTCL